MLIFGPYTACINLVTQDDAILNFTSLNQSMPRLGYLLPSLDVFNTDPDTLYKMYCDTLQLNQYAFSQLMEIMMPLYEGKNTYVCTCGDEIYNPYLQTMQDLLVRFIQERYGYNPVFINEPEDLESFNSGDYNFTVNGIMIFDDDKQRYILQREEDRLRMGGRPYAKE